MEIAVSVIVPTFNEELYIEKCLKSIRNQEFNRNIEIIVVDSNSRDKTVTIAKKYASKVIVIKKRGVSHARNLGAKESGGKILLFVDGDTILQPDVITEVLRTLRNSKSVGACVSLISDNAKKNFLYEISICLYRFLKILNLHPMYAVCFACKRNSFMKVGGFNERLYAGEDIELGQRLKSLGQIEYITKTFAVTSARRLNKLSLFKNLNGWPGGYFYFKFFNKQPEYPPGSSLS